MTTRPLLLSLLLVCQPSLLILGCAASKGSDAAEATDATDGTEATDSVDGLDTADSTDSSEVADSPDATDDTTGAPDVTSPEDVAGTDSEEDAAGVDSGEVADAPDTAPPDSDSTCDATECAAKATACKTAKCFQGACLIVDSSEGCDDGDPCTLGDSCLAGTCAGFAQVGCCTPHCEDKVCGDDGCGKSCGECTGGKLCGGEGTCVEAGTGGETCADAVVVGALPFSVTWTTAGLSNDYLTPALACHTDGLGTYGNDAVYRYTADFTGYLVIGLTGLGVQTDVYVLESCADTKYGCTIGTSSIFEYPTLPISAPVVDGHTYYIVVDGSSPGGAFTLSLDACSPDCDGKEREAAPIRPSGVLGRLRWRRAGVREGAVSAVRGNF